MTRYLYFSAFAICGIAFYIWIETWAQAHRQAMERLLEESEESRCATIHYNGSKFIIHPNGSKTAVDNGTTTDSPPHITHTN